MAFDLLVTFVLSTLIMDQRSVLAQLRLVNRPANASVGAGRRASFGCEAVDQELRPVVVSWSNGNQSTADSTFPSRFTFDSQSGVLNLDPVQCADARWYTCRVSTADESIDVRVHLNVVCRGRAPSFTRKLSSWYSFTPNQNSLLYCYSSGEPSPEISWHRQGVRLPTSKPTGGGPFAEDGVLNLQFSSSQDSGVYSCVAWNVFGSTTQDSRVVIRSDSSPILSSWWMVTLFVGVAMLASFLAVLVAVVCREFLLGRRGRTELVGKPKQKRNNSLGMASIVSGSAAGWSEPMTRQTTMPSLGGAPSEKTTPSHASEHAFSGMPPASEVGGLGGAMDRDSAVNPAFGVEMATMDTYFRPLSWHEYWKRQQDSSPGLPMMVSALHPVRRHTFNNHTTDTNHTSNQLFHDSASPQQSKGRQPQQQQQQHQQQHQKSDKIRKSDGKDIANHRRGSVNSPSHSPTIDMTLQLVECDDEDLVPNPSMFDVLSKGSHAEEQTEKAFAFLEDYDDVTSQDASEIVSFGASTADTHQD